MPRRSLITAISVVVALGLIAVAPSLPFVRDAIVERALRVVEGAGVTVEYDRSTGNPWREIALHDARVRAPGADVEVRSLRLGYFLPSLLGGELPVDIDVAGVTGDVDLQELLDRLALSGGGGVSVRLRQISLADVSLNAARLPFKLPDISVDALRLEQQGTALLIAVALHTQDGRLEADGRYESLTGTFTGDVTHADVSLARAWWQGARSGTASGPITVRGSLVEGTFQIREGEVDYEGLNAVAIQGEARLRYPVIEAELSATAMGGPVSARGVVNVSARRWEASGLASAELAQAAGWLARDEFPDGLPLDVDGIADVQLRLSGWKQIEGQGEVDGYGSIAGVPLPGFAATFRLPADGAMRVDGSGTLGGAPVTFTMGPGQGATSTRLVADGIDLTGSGLPGVVDLAVALAGSARGDVVLAWRGELGGREVNADLDATLGPDGWSGFLSGSDEQGNAFEGAAVLRDGRLEGEVTALGAFPELFTSGARVSVRAVGPIGRLELTATLAGPQPVSLAALGERGVDIRGSATGVLVDGSISDISGALGPLRVAGAVALDPLAALFDVELLPVAAGGSTSVSVAGGRLEVAGGSASLAGELSLLGDEDAGGSLLSTALSLVAELSPAGVSATAAAHDGSLSLALSGEDAAGPYDVRLAVAAGTAVAGLELVSGAMLSGTVTPATRTVTAAGRLGELPLTGTASWSAAGTSATATLVSEPGSELALEARTGDLGGGDGVAWRASGSLDMAALLTQLGLDLTAAGDVSATPLTGELTGSYAQGSLTDTAGSLTADVSLSPDQEGVLALTIVGVGAGLGFEVAGEVGGLPVAVDGTLAPTTGAGEPLAIAARAAIGPFEGIALDASGASGAGVVSFASDADSTGLQFAADVPWRLEARWDERSGTLGLGDGAFDLRLVDGGFLVAGAAGVAASLGAEEYRLALAVSANGPVSSASNVTLTGSVATSQGAAASGETLVSFSGPPQALALEAEVGLAHLASILGAGGFEPSGSLNASGLMDLTAGPGYALEVEVSAAPSDDVAPYALSGTLAGAGTDFRLALSGDGLDLAFRDQTLTLTAVDATLAPFLPTGFDGSLVGLLRLQAGAWSGDLLLNANGSGLTAGARLSGAGPRLMADVSVQHQLGSLAASGTLVPELDLSGSLSALDGNLVGALAFDGASGLTADLATPALSLDDLAELPAQTAQLRWRPGAPASLAGTGIELGAAALSGDGEVTGSLALDGQLLGRPATVFATLEGTLAEPLLSASLAREGATATATGGPERLEVAVSIAPDALAEDLAGRMSAAAAVGDLIAGPMSLNGVWTPTTGLELTGAADLATPVASAVRLSLAGAPDAYSGRLDLLGENGVLASFAVAGAGTEAHAELDLADVAWDEIAAALGADVAVSGGGAVTLTSNPPAAVVVADLSADVGGVAVALSGASTEALRLSLDGEGVSLAGDVRFGDGISADLSGTAAGAPVEARLNVDSSYAEGSLAITGTGLNATAEVSRSAAGFELDGLRATAAASNGPLARLGSLQVNASGPLSPRPEVTGAVSAAARGESATLRFGAAADDPVATETTAISIAWRELAASFELASGELRLNGDLELAFGPDGGVVLTPDADLPEDATLVTAEGIDLIWTATRGVTGEAEITTRSPGLYRLIGISDAAASLTTDAQGTLTLAAQAGSEVGFRATLPPLLRSDGPLTDALSGALTGTLDFELTVAGQLGSLVFTGSPAVTGELTDPRLAGPVALAGDLTGSGELRYAGGNGLLTLAGEHLSLDANGSGSEWSVAAALDDWTLPSTLPQVGGARVSLKAAGATVPELAVTVTDLRLTKGSSLVTGGAVLAPALRFALQAQVDLADFELGAAHGLLRGPVVLTADSPGELRSADVIAMLDAARVGYGTFGDLNGSLQLGGDLADPRIGAVLVGEGSVTGALRIDAYPARGDLTLTSDLVAFGLVTDLDLALTDGSARARGLVRYGEAVLVVSDAPQGLELAGAGQLEGWRASISSDLSHAELVGGLGSFSPSLTGQVALELGGEGTGAWLDGALTGLAAGDVQLGSLAVTSQTLGAPIVLTGEELNARFEPAGLAWRLDVAGLTLPAGLTLAASASGRALSGEGSARLTAASEDTALALAGDEIVLDFSLGEEIVLVGEGTVLGGHFALDGVRSQSGDWSGQVALESATVAGVRVSATGLLLGDGPIPGAVLATTAVDGSDELEAVGRLALSSQGVSLDQQLVLPGAASVVRVQGRAFPDTDLLIGAEPALAAAEEAQVVGALRLFTTGEGLRSSGRLTGYIGGVEVSLGERAADGVLTLDAALPALDAGLRASLDGEDLVGLVSDVMRRGLVLQGTGTATGDVVLALAPEPRAELIDFGLSLAGFTLSASGSLSGRAADLEGALLLPTDLPVATASGRLDLPWNARMDAGSLSLSSRGELGAFDVAYDTQTGSLLADIDLALPLQDGTAGTTVASGSIRGRLGYTRQAGASGTLEVADVRLAPAGIGAVTIAADLAIADDRVGGAATVDTSGGRLSLTGNWDLAALLGGSGSADAPTGDGAGAVELRVRTLELSAFPAIASSVPHVSGAVSGVVQLRGGLLLGQLLAPDLVLGGREAEAFIEITGSPQRIGIAARLLGSLITAEVASGRVSGSARLERFPAELLAESVVGPTDVSADLTGVLRFELPFDRPQDGYLRLATERFLLERAGVLTESELSVVYQDSELVVERAEFVGRGEWRASGRLGPELLDFELTAEDADFAPLLGLVPQLARLGAGAQGSFSFLAEGSATDPRISLVSDGLAFELGGASFGFDAADISLVGDELTASVEVTSGAPAAGKLSVDGRARLLLEPLALREIDFGIFGSLVVPGVGVIEDIVGSIALTPDFLPYLRLSGSLGAPISLSGTLIPLDLRAGGTDLSVSVPSLLIGHAVVDTDLRLRSTPAGLELGGEVLAQEVVIDPAAASRIEDALPVADAPSLASDAASSAPAVGSEPGSSRSQTAPAATAETPSRAEGAALTGFIFSDLRITAPQRVTFDSSFASLEATVDLTLSGNAAQPRLSGEASALRGSLRFAGREFTVESAVATFAPARGYYPSLDVVAHTDLEKTRALQGATGVEFVAPDGPSFRITLAFSGPVESAPAGEGGFRFDVRPLLTSDAMIEVAGGSGMRALTEAELLTLLTLGRLELNPTLGSSGVGGAVAQGAIDAALDLFVVSELQNALREALGLDVVEIRTSAFSSLLGDAGAPFSVSVRLGGYISPELFASYRIGTRDDPASAFAITNEVTLSYALGPVDLDLTGRLDFPAAGILASPRPELGFGLRYDFTPSFSIDGGVVLSTERSVVRFGVSLRW